MIDYMLKCTQIYVRSTTIFNENEIAPNCKFGYKNVIKFIKTAQVTTEEM